MRSILLTSPHSWMELEARSRGSGTARSSFPVKPRGELSYQCPIQIWAGSPSRATGHVSGYTNRFLLSFHGTRPRLGPVSARAPSPARRTPRRAPPRAATLRPCAPLREPQPRSARPRAALLTVRLSREITTPPPKAPRVRPTKAPQRRSQPRGVAGQG